MAVFALQTDSRIKAAGLSESSDKGREQAYPGVKAVEWTESSDKG
jgi:hypothetical protein